MKGSTLYEWNNEVEEEIFKKFDRTKAMVDEDVRSIQQWMKTQPHLPEVMDSRSIKLSLIASKGSVEIAKKKIDSHYTVKVQYPELYRGFNPKLPHMKRIFDGVYIVPLPKLTEQLSKVYVYKIRDKSVQKEMKHIYVNAHNFHIVEIHMRENIDLGVSMIIDFTDFTTENVKLFDTVVAHKSMLIFTEIYKFPIKGVYIVNPAPIVNAILRFAKSVLSPKIVQRMHICKDDELLNYFSKRVLPKDYGGEEKSLEELNEMMKVKFAEYQDRFDETENFNIDLSLRPKTLRNDEILGVYGNFRKLDID